MEERPRVKRRQKRSSCDAGTQQEAVAQSTSETLRPAPTDDPYAARRQEYLAQLELVRCRQALFYQNDRMQHRRRRDFPIPVGVDCELPEEPNNVPYDPSISHRPVGIVDRPSPPPYSAHNDSDSDRDKSQSSGQRPRHHHRRRKREPPSPCPVVTPPYSCHLAHATRVPLPPPPPPPPNATSVASDNSCYSTTLLPEPLPRYSIADTPRVTASPTSNSCDNHSTNHHSSRNICSTPTSDASRNFREQLNPIRGETIQCIDCSCGTNLQSDSMTCDGTCVNSSTTNVHQRPTSIYISPSSTNDDIDDMNYNVVSIGECVSSAVAADPSIFGPHNLYQNQDMPAPDYHLEASSSTYNDTISNSPTSSKTQNNSQQISNSSETSTLTPTRTTQNVTAIVTEQSPPLSNICDVSDISVGDTETVPEIREDMSPHTNEDKSTEGQENDNSVESCIDDITRAALEEEVQEITAEEVTGAIGGRGVESSSCSGDSDSDGGVMSDDELNDEEVALALQAAEVTAAWRARSRFSDPHDLIQRLFVCISGVADQLQTNYASDLRRILKTVFLLNQSPDSDEDEILGPKEGKPPLSDHDAQSTSNGE